ncbi:putative glutaredoxin [Thozetella sp. PMI_491]|nr:putative glutaredoxin [Thozetella sp. PMI_491]
MSSAKAKAQQLIDNNAVVVFSKSYCPYCKATKRTLDQRKAKYTAIELDQEDDGADIQAALAQINGQTTVPNIYIAQEHIGGNSDLQALGDLDELLKKAGAV